MRFPSDVAIHALRLMKHAQENNMNEPAKLSLYLPLATNRALLGIVPEGRRRLENKDSSSMNGAASIAMGQSDEFDIMSSLQGPYFDKIQQCGVKIEDFVEDVMMATLTGDDSGSEEEMVEKVLTAFGNDTNQAQCTEIDMMNAMGAYQAFMSCTGIDSFIGQIALAGDKLDKIGDDIEKNCGYFDDAFTGTPFFLDTPPTEEERALPTLAEMNGCFGSIFGPGNVVGNFVKKIYQYPDNLCQCAQTLGESIPDCTIDEEGVTLSLSLIGTSTCIMGVGCEAYRDHCAVESVALDNCLPDLDEEFDCNSVMYKCGDRGSVLAFIPPIISSTVPDICESIISPSVSARYESFQKKCMKKKDFFSDDYDFSESEEQVELSSPAAKTVTKYVSQTEPSNNEMPEKSEGSSFSSHFLGIPFVLCFVGVAASVMMYKKRTDHLKDDFAPLSSNGIEFEENSGSFA